MSQPDFIQEIMEKDYGTRVLITDPESDRYLEEHKRRKLKQQYPNLIQDED